MDMKIKFRFDWHWGIPDGEESYEIVVDWFDIENKDVLESRINEAFTRLNIQIHDVEPAKHAYRDVYVIIADMEKGIRSSCDVQISYEFVIEHQGRYFKCEEIFLNQ